MRFGRLRKRVGALDARGQLAAADGHEQAGESVAVRVGVLDLEADATFGGERAEVVQEGRDGGDVRAAVSDRRSDALDCSTAAQTRDLAVFGVVFAVVGLLSCLVYAVVLGTSGGVLRRPRLADAFLRGSGGLLVVFGAGLAVEGVRTA